MHPFRSQFPNGTAIILPVIHSDALDQTSRNTEVARTAGCDGVFIINHSIQWTELLRIGQGVSTEFPDLWLGVNCLDLSPTEVFARVDKSISGIWVDNAEVDEQKEDQAAAEEILLARNQSGWQGLYFGGVAFKYQRHVADLEAASRKAARYVDVITTSGPGTGRAAPIEKIAALKRGLGDAPLAIASGITPGNVSQYVGLAECFLVATGVSRSFTELDPELLRALIGAVRTPEAA